MITASCQFCEDVRREESGQESIVGIFRSCNVVYKGNYLKSLCVIVNLHISFDSIDENFGIKIVGDQKNEWLTSFPPPEYKGKVVADAREFGLEYAIFPATFDLLDLPKKIEEEHLIEVFLLVGDSKTRIGSFTAIPLSEES